MIDQNFYYPFQTLKEKYIFIKHYNRTDMPLCDFFIIVAQKNRSTEYTTFRFDQYIYCWRIITDPLFTLYKKTLKKYKPILVHQQFSVYEESVYLETYSHYSGIPANEFRHLCIDFDSVLIEIISGPEIYYVFCLGESLLPYEE